METPTPASGAAPTPGAALALGGVPPLRPAGAGLLLSRADMRHPARLTDFFALLFVRRGVLSIQEDGRRFAVRAGETLLLWPGRPHAGTATYPADLEFFWLHFALPDAPAPGESPAGESPAGESPLRVPQHGAAARPDVLEELFRRYLNGLETGALTPLQCQLSVWFILAEAALERAPEGGAGGEAGRRADMLAGRAYRHIRAHFHRPLTASTVAAAVGCGPQYLSRVFRAAYRQTLTQCIHRTRLERARVLLIHSGLNASEVARACGFENVGYFYRTFRRHEGATALAYRRRHALTQVVVD